MKKILTGLFLLCFLPLGSIAQLVRGNPMDSTMLQFSNSMGGYVADTATSPLWQIGTTSKMFFETAGMPVHGIMTDTMHPYRMNANNWFVLKIVYGVNEIVDFWHKYQMDSTHAGGAVEFSVDNGVSWTNIKGHCNQDGVNCSPGIRTENFYGSGDTIFDGTQAFSGTQDTPICSKFQFFGGCQYGPIGSCNLNVDTFYIRFRFISDSTNDSLAGWSIDSIKLEVNDYSGEAVKTINKLPLKVFPNPTTDFTFEFPPLADQEAYNISVFDAMGQKIIDLPYTQSLNLVGRQPGVYFYKVTNGTDYYSGQLVVE